MQDGTRRGFLTMMATGAAAATVARTTGDGPPGASGKVLRHDLREPLVAHVGDPDRGEISLMVGESEVVVHDPDLVARLALAAGR